MDEIRISSWDELNERLYEGSWNPSLGRVSLNIRIPWCRNRSPGFAEPAWRAWEVTILSLSAISFATSSNMPTGRSERAEISGKRSRFAQHHGLPTRLLDWTYSPYVAMHFATANVERFHRDAVIWCIDFVASNRFLPEATANPP
ncbi:MAG: FRG domain-containing protein [Thermomicrobiales bacterium]|nr:MAG: FRG domain-containing protein [Thermomicrobiales bacterium]